MCNKAVLPSKRKPPISLCEKSADFLKLKDTRGNFKFGTWGGRKIGRKKLSDTDDTQRKLEDTTGQIKHAEPLGIKALAEA